MSYEIGDTLHYTCAETAKFVRQTLKEAFPGVKFAVRCEISTNVFLVNVNYTSGPSREQIEKAVEQYQGSEWSHEYECKLDRFTTRDGRKVSYGASIRVHRNNTVDSTIVDVTPRQIKAAK